MIRIYPRSLSVILCKQRFNGHLKKSTMPCCNVQIGERDPTSLQFIDWDEIKTFKTEKRRNEHLSARWLLEEALNEWGDLDCSQLMISRTDERAPYLQAIQGLWIQPKLPSLSISHSEQLACVALIEHGWTVGSMQSHLLDP